MSTYELTFRLQVDGPQPPTFLASLLDGLDRAHVVNDISDVDSEGYFTVWLEVDADIPEAAVSTGFAALNTAQDLARATGAEVSSHFRSAEFQLASA